MTITPAAVGHRQAPARIVLVHGAATTSRVWRHVVPLLADQPFTPNAAADSAVSPDPGAPDGPVVPSYPARGGFDVRCPDRAVTGDLAAEVAALAPVCRGAIVAGVSGGATLGLALAASGAGLAGAVLHEPAVGSLLPGLLDPMVAAYRAGGMPAFAAALYGPAWTPGEAPADPGAVARDLAMFRAFEPAPPLAGEGPVLLTVGALSPPVRHESVHRLGVAFGLPVAVIPGAAHAVHLENPAAFAAEIRSLAAGQ